MAEKIEQLTPAEQALIPIVQDEWLKIGLATGPADREAVQAAITDAYRMVGHAPPSIWIWLGSPWAGCIGAWLLDELVAVPDFSPRYNMSEWEQQQVEDQVRDQLGHQTWLQVRDQLWRLVGWQMENQVRSQVVAQVRDQAWIQAPDQIREQVRELLVQRWNDVRDFDWNERLQAWHQVGDRRWIHVLAQMLGQVWDQMRDRVRAQVDDRVWDRVQAQMQARMWSRMRDHVWDRMWNKAQASKGPKAWDRLNAETQARVAAEMVEEMQDQMRVQAHRAIYGQHDAGSLAVFDFFRRTKRVEGPDRLEPLMRVAALTGWWWRFDDTCIITQRPTALHRDEAGRLHCDSGPAMAYPDGWAIHAWHGIRIPAWFVEDKQRITPDAIEAEENAEFRRVMLEIFGFDRYIEARGAKLIAEDECLGLPRQLFEIDLAGERIRVLRVVNGTVEADGRRRQFHLGVPLECNTPHEAVAWSYGRPAAVYGEHIRS
jgi:hypothetical protein